MRRAGSVVSVVVIITGAFFAERATAVDDKLNVRGGVISGVRVGADRLLDVSLVVLLQAAQLDDVGAPVVEFELRPPNDEDPLRLPLRVRNEALSSDGGFQIYGIRVSVPFDGRWVCLVSAGGARVLLPLTIRG